MLIKALCEYADKKAASQSETIEEGWGEQAVNYLIKLSSDGDLLEIIPSAPSESKKKSSKKLILPQRTQKPGICSNYIEHRPLYIFGLNYEEGKFTPDDKTNKARKSHEAFVKHELEFLNGLDSDICIAYRKFIEKWMPENETENNVLVQLGKDYKGAYFGIILETGTEGLEADSQLKEKYNRIFFSESQNVSDSPTAVCGILGENLEIARLHDKIKFPGGQTSGCQLVCMNDTAFESYGKTQSYNSNVSEEAMKKYTYTLNQLLADKNHRTIVGDMVITYFAMKPDDSKECSLYSMLAFGGDNAKENEIDDSRENEINKLMSYAENGYTGDEKYIDKIEADTESTFYIAGFTPNSSRICQKFVYRDKFGNLLKNLIKHQNDLQINESNTRPVYFYGIQKELVSPKSSNEKAPSPLMTSIMLAAFNNTKYPDGLLSTVIRRIKIDSDEEKNRFIKLNDTRAGIIKACLNRKHQKEEITMAWNDENKNQAYLCGGLFAVYEKIQQDSSGGGLNRTIKDSYFASACSRPASVFPKLAKLSQNHMRKLSEGSCIYYNKMIGEITNELCGEFPSTLNLDDQGRFIIGYYQMNKKLYTSNKENGKED